MFKVLVVVVEEWQRIGKPSMLRVRAKATTQDNMIWCVVVLVSIDCGGYFSM